MSVELTFLISAVTALTGTILGILGARRNGPARPGKAQQRNGDDNI